MLFCSIHLHSTVKLSCPIHLHPTEISHLLCVCVCLCVWLCVCVCAHVYVYVCMYCVCVCVYVCVCVGVHIPVHSNLCHLNVYGCAKESVSSEVHYWLGMPSAHYYYDYCFTLHWTALLQQLPWWPYGPHTWTTGLCGSVWSMCSDPTLLCRYGWPQRKGSICNAEIND